MLKNYAEMRKIDVSKYCEKRDGFEYLNWAKCIDLLRENGAEKVYFVPIPDEKTGSSLRMTEQVFADKNGVTNRCYETAIKVVIDDNEYTMISPVMNGTNPVKDNSMSQQRVWNSMCRSFVKCVAIQTGLGFDLWIKEETQPFNNVMNDKDEKPSKASLDAFKEKCKKHQINLEYWIKSAGKTIDTITASELAQMERAVVEKYGSDV